MTDNKKQKAKDEFKKIVNSEMDALFAKPLSGEEVDLAMMQEAGKVLEKITTMDKISSDLKEETIAVAQEISVIQKGVADLTRITKIKEELNKAA